MEEAKGENSLNKHSSMHDLIAEDTPLLCYRKAKDSYEHFKELSRDADHTNYLYKILLCKRYMDAIEGLTPILID